MEPSFDLDEKLPRDEDGFRVDVDGYEGPLDLLLDLARRQKVDLHKISVLALAEQYLAFIEAARGLRLELAADYLVMAAWLAYLKSRLLLPEAVATDEPEAADLAAALAERLRRLEAIRAAAAALSNRPQLGRDLFQRGCPEGVEGVTAAPTWEASLFDLLAAYARQRQKTARARVTVAPRVVWSLAEARELLGRIIGQAMEWTALDSYLIAYCVTPEARRTVRASTFSAMLEMVREGLVALRQEQAFAPLWIKNRPHPAPVALVPGEAGGQGG